MDTNSLTLVMWSSECFTMKFINIDVIDVINDHDYKSVSTTCLINLQIQILPDSYKEIILLAVSVRLASGIMSYLFVM